MEGGGREGGRITRDEPARSCPRESLSTALEHRTLFSTRRSSRGSGDPSGGPHVKRAGGGAGWGGARGGRGGGVDSTRTPNDRSPRVARAN